MCSSTVIPPLANRCQRCSAPVGPHLVTENGCQHCRDHKLEFTAVVSLGSYQGPLRPAVLRMKQAGGDALAAALTRKLFHLWHDRLHEWNPDLIIPVPHHWTERCWRSHLPPATMADALGRLLRLPVERHVLRKRRRTRSQTSLPISRRRQNLRNAFGMAGGARLDDATVLLVDDVLTTGTTADRVSRELKKAGTRQVFVAVIARGIGAEWRDVPQD